MAPDHFSGLTPLHFSSPTFEFYDDDTETETDEGDSMARIHFLIILIDLNNELAGLVKAPYDLDYDSTTGIPKGL